MSPRELIAWTNRIRWRSESEITPVALIAIEDHVRRMADILPQVVATTSRPVAEAHGSLLTPAHDSAAYAEIFDILADHGNSFRLETC